MSVLVEKIQDFPSQLVEIALKDDATVPELLRIVFTFTVIWFIFFAIAGRILKKISYGTPWLRECMERDYERGGKQLMEVLYEIHDREEALQQMMDDWPFMMVMYSQHIIGAAFVVPSLLGLGDPKLATALAMCGLMSEMGWEIEHMAEFTYERYFTEGGKKSRPMTLFMIVIFHHSLATLLGMPMLLHYRHLKSLHWLIFDLQLAGGLSFLPEYSKFLDITKPDELRRFKIINFILLVFMIWSRFLHWIYLCFDIISVWYAEKAWVFIIGGAPSLLAFSLFNYVFCIQPMYSRFMKFLHVSAEYDALPADAPKETRRSSVMTMKIAAADLLEEATADAGFFPVPIFEPRKEVTKRHSIAAPSHRMKRMSMTKMRTFSVPAHVAAKEWSKEE